MLFLQSIPFYKKSLCYEYSEFLLCPYGFLINHKNNSKNSSTPLIVPNSKILKEGSYDDREAYGYS
jgi:hypothetical protein